MPVGTDPEVAARIVEQVEAATFRASPGGADCIGRPEPTDRIGHPQTAAASSLKP